MATQEWKDEHQEDMRRWRREHYHKNKEQYYGRNKKQENILRKFIRNLKKASQCKICGESDSRCLDFHHKNPEHKELEISRVAHNGWSLEHLKKEIAKCVIICANCHRKKHMCKICNRLKSNHSNNCRFYRPLVSTAAHLIPNQIEAVQIGRDLPFYGSIAQRDRAYGFYPFDSRSSRDRASSL